MTLAVTYKELMEKLGVGRELMAYETMPWSCYDADEGATCSAEIRRSGSDEEIEGEIQLMYEDPKPGKPSMQQICYLKGNPSRGDWTIVALKIKGEPFGEDIYDWQGKSCDFFREVVQYLKRDEIPDFDELIEEAFKSRERFADQRGGGGKSPKVKAGQLLGHKKGGKGM